jgi:hypothetical protein
MIGLRIAQVCAGGEMASGAVASASQPMNGVTAGLTALGHHVTIFSALSDDGDFPVFVPRLEDLITENRIDVVDERYSIGHRGGLDVARRLGVPFVLELDAPLTPESYTYRAEKVMVTDCVIEDELLAAADLVITVSTELMLWAARRRNGPTITLSNAVRGSDSLAWIASARCCGIRLGDCSTPDRREEACCGDQFGHRSTPHRGRRGISSSG